MLLPEKICAMTSRIRPPPPLRACLGRGGLRVDVCVGFIGWHEIKSSLVLRGGGGKQLPLHAIWHQSWARSKSGLAFMLTFLNIKLLKNYTCYSIEKIMEDSEQPSAKIGIFEQIMIIGLFRAIGR